MLHSSNISLFSIFSQLYKSPLDGETRRDNWDKLFPVIVTSLKIEGCKQKWGFLWGVEELGSNKRSDETSPVAHDSLRDVLASRTITKTYTSSYFVEHFKTKANNRVFHNSRLFRWSQQNIIYKNLQHWPMIEPRSLA